MTPGSSGTTTGATNMAPAAAQSVSGPGATADCQIRFSNAQYDYDGIPDQFQVQTSTFKNSVYNTAHYRNPNFQPEECRPDGDLSEKRSSAKKKKRQDP
jgi:ubiquitin thioesterase protein OTUB1